jgi:hypothetical protein
LCAFGLGRLFAGAVFDRFNAGQQSFAASATGMVVSLISGILEHVGWPSTRWQASSELAVLPAGLKLPVSMRFPAVNAQL